MNLKWLEKAPLPTVLVLISAILGIVAAAGGFRYGEASITLDSTGVYFVGAFALAFFAAGVLLRIANPTKLNKRMLIVNFDGITPNVRDEEKFEIDNLTTVDGFLDEIYNRRLRGVVEGGTYGTKWVLVTEAGDKLYNVGSEWAARQGISPSPGRNRSIDERLVRDLRALFRPGSTLRVQRPDEKCPPNETVQQDSRTLQTERLGERIIYSSAGRDVGFDFRGERAQIWQTVDGVDRPVSGFGEGTLSFENGQVLNIRRSNTDGRYAVTLETYFFGGTVTPLIPRDDAIVGQRSVRVSFEAKSIGAEHTLRILLKNEETNKWVAPHRERRISDNLWIPVREYFQFSPEQCKLRIGDLNVTKAPSSVQIRNFTVAERVI
jgi:hypothetical protein